MSGGGDGCLHSGPYLLSVWLLLGLRLTKCEHYPNNTLCFVVLDKLYCNVYVTCKFCEL